MNMGKVYFGKSGFSGEFGHFSFFENEILCHCGKKGCLETGASGSALYRTLLERYKEGSNTILASKIDAGEYIGLSDLIDAIHKEDMLSIEILEEIGFNLGKGIAGLMNIFNPELVVLGGPAGCDVPAASFITIPRLVLPTELYSQGNLSRILPILHGIGQYTDLEPLLKNDYSPLSVLKKALQQ